MQLSELWEGTRQGKMEPGEVCNRMSIRSLTVASRHCWNLESMDEQDRVHFPMQMLHVNYAHTHTDAHYIHIIT